MRRLFWILSGIISFCNLCGQDTLEYPNSSLSMLKDTTLKKGIWQAKNLGDTTSLILEIDFAKKILTRVDRNGKKIVQNEYYVNLPLVFERLYFDNGQIASAGYLINQGEIGLWEYWYENGQIKSRQFWPVSPSLIHTYDSLEKREFDRNITKHVFMCSYVDSTQEYKTPEGYSFFLVVSNPAFFQDYYPNGKTMVACRLSADSVSVIRNTFYENGKTEIEERYVAGKREGHYKEWNERGQIVVSGQYRNNQKVGTWLFYKFGGLLKKKKRFREKISSKISG